MDLSKRRWYVTWFFLSLAIIDEFVKDWGNRPGKYSRGTNLCSFMRVSFLWAPLIIVLHLAVYAGAIYVATYLPIRLFGLTGYGSILTGLAVLAAVVVVYKMVANAVSSYRYQRRIDRLHAEQPAAEPVPEGPSFAFLFWDYMAALKQRICPTINFR